MAEHPTGPMPILQAPLPPPPRRTPPVPPLELTPAHYRLLPHLQPPTPPGRVQVEIVRPFRTAWAVGLGLFAAGWTVTLAAAVLWLIGLVILAAVFGVALVGGG